MTDTSKEAVEQMIGESDYSCGDSDSAKDDMLRALVAERDDLQTKLNKAIDGFREIAGECGCSTARATIEEIKENG